MTMWIKAINAGFFALWPMLTARSVNMYFSESPETQKGHMRQQRQEVQGKRKANIRRHTLSLSHNREAGK